MISVRRSLAVAITLVTLVVYRQRLDDDETQHSVPAFRERIPFDRDSLSRKVNASFSTTVIVAYSSNNPEETLLWGSSRAHHTALQRERRGNVTQLVSVGQGLPLFNPTAEGESTRGWMFRFRAMVEGIMKEYDARDRQDFIVVVGDAFDTFVTESAQGDTMRLIQERFHTEFGGYSIVFSSQIYCCNPWNLRDVGHAAWDDYYATIGGPKTLYKHLNAGMFMGYASAIMDMANEMEIWDTEYRRPEEFDPILQSEDASKLHMFDVDVDDDEWQLSIWFLKEQLKKHPRAALDVNQSLFTTTGTFRASYRDGGFVILSHNDFYGIVGSLPASFNKKEIDAIKQCPYTYDSKTKTWTNTITKSNPLIFHFAGNDWLCGCQILEGSRYANVTEKFAQSCSEEYPLWHTSVNQGVQAVALGKNPEEQRFLKKNGTRSRQTSI
jgi:hypothetical protein